MRFIQVAFTNRFASPNVHGFQLGFPQSLSVLVMMKWKKSMAPIKNYQTIIAWHVTNYKFIVTYIDVCAFLFTDIRMEDIIN